MKTASTNKRILVIDDEASIRNHFLTSFNVVQKDKQDALENAATTLFGNLNSENETKALDFDITVAENGQKGLEKVKEALANDQPFAALFCDIRMPRWDGLKTVTEIRKIDPNIEIIFMTAFSDYSAEELSNQVGMDTQIIAKPYRNDEIISTANKALYEWNAEKSFQNQIRTLLNYKNHQNQPDRIFALLLDEIASIHRECEVAVIRKTDKSNLSVVHATGPFKKSVEAINTLCRIQSSHGLKNGKVLHAIGNFIVEHHNQLSMYIQFHDDVSGDDAQKLSTLLSTALPILAESHLHQEIEKAKKFQRINQVMTLFAKDIRNPFCRIEKAFHQLNTDLSEKYPKELTQIDWAIKEIHSLIYDALDYGVMKINISPRKQDLIQTIQYEIEELKTYIPQCEILLTSEHKREVLHYDDQQISRVLRTLIFDLLKEGQEENTKVEIEINRNQSEIIIGISPQPLPENLLNLSESNDISFFIASEIMKAHGGSININDSDEEFPITLSIPIK